MARIVHLIESETMRGNGISTAMRAVRQFWTLNGDLVFEIDPCPDDKVRDERDTETTG